MLNPEYYSNNSIAVFGDSKPWKDNLKSLGGRWNQNLNGRAGWIFPRNREQELMQLISQVNSGSIQPQPFQQTTFQGSIPSPVPLNFNQQVMNPLESLNRLSLSRNLNNTENIQQPIIQQPTIRQPMIQPQRPYTNIQSLQSNTSFPNYFTAADGLTYQIIMTTAVVPTLNQRVSINSGDTTNEYTVSFVKEQYPVDIVKITSNNDASVLTLNIINGNWKVNSNFEGEHTIVFHPSS
jgi:hypothetical protein